MTIILSGSRILGEEGRKGQDGMAGFERGESGGVKRHKETGVTG